MLKTLWHKIERGHLCDQSAAMQTARFSTQGLSQKTSLRNSKNISGLPHLPESNRNILSKNHMTICIICIYIYMYICDYASIIKYEYVNMKVVTSFTLSCKYRRNSTISLRSQLFARALGGPLHQAVQAFLRLLLLHGM